MSSPDHHIIRRQVIELSISDRDGAYRFQRHVSELFQSVVSQQLGEAFDRLGLGHRVLRIPRLEIDLGVISPATFDRDFSEACTLAVTRAVREVLYTLGEAKTDVEDFKVAISGGAARLLSPVANKLESLEYFLREGRLPATERGGTWAEREREWQAILAERPAAARELMQRIAQDSARGFKRLLLQFDGNWVIHLLKSVPAFPTNEDQWPRSESPDFGKGPDALISALRVSLPWVEQLPIAFQRFVSIEILRRKGERASEWVATSGRGLGPVILRTYWSNVPVHLTNLLDQSPDFTPKQTVSPSGVEQATSTKDNPPATDQEVDRPERDTPDGEAVDLAGIVLLHPFLPNLFRALGWLEGPEWMDTHARERAMHLLVYLATGEEQRSEHDFRLPKILCGWVDNMPVDRFLVLDPEERKEGERLLNAVVHHWTALKGSSPDGLREAFLHRMGLLEENDNGYHLIVERKGQDVLIEKLPWGIGFIKLPWLEEQITVAW